MTPDQVCIAAIEAGFVRVDPHLGLAYSARFRPQVPLGGISRDGYRVCTLHFGGHHQQVKVHRLIWMSVNGPIADGLMIDHINRIKADNRIVNLRLADPILNSANRRDYAGEGNPSAKIDRRIAGMMRSRHAEGLSYSRISTEFGVSKSLVAQVVRGELWSE